MISLKTKIETAVRMGANCGSLDLTSDDTKTSIDLDDADIQALHDGLCDTEKLAWSCDDNKNLQSLNAEICAKSNQFEAMLRVANGTAADLQKVTDTLRSELANARWALESAIEWSQDGGADPVDAEAKVKGAIARVAAHAAEDARQAERAAVRKLCLDLGSQAAGKAKGEPRTVEKQARAKAFRDLADLLTPKKPKAKKARKVTK